MTHFVQLYSCGARPGVHPGRPCRAL